MAVLNSKFDILRGWPDGSAVAEDFTKSTKTAGDAAVFRAGHFVALGRGTDGVAGANMSAGGKLSAINSGPGTALGLVIEGEEETSSNMSNTVTCLIGGGYVVRLHLEADFTQNAYGNATIPGGVNQYVKIRLAADLAGNADITITAGMRVFVEAGQLKLVETGVPAEEAAIVGTVLATTSDTIDVLIH